MNWYLKVLKQYADFKGRARRKEYWMYVLFNFIIIISLLAMAFVTGDGIESPNMLFYGLYMLYALGTFIPSLAVAVRRLHDTGRSGWYYFMGLIPFVGFIILIVFFCQDSKLESNEWGPNPKNATDELNDIGVA